MCMSLKHINPLNIPKLEKYVNDFSWVLSLDKQMRLNELFAEHERTTTEQVVVVLFPHRDGNELIDIGLKVFNENEIWVRWKNNGLLLIISTEEKKIRIITGKWMELKYSEMVCRDIIENKLRPILMSEDYSLLIETFYGAIDETQTYDSVETWYTNTVEDFKSQQLRTKIWIFSIVSAVFCGPIVLLMLPSPINLATIFLTLGIWGMIASYMVWKQKGISYKILWGILFLISLGFIIPNLKVCYCYNKTDISCEQYIRSYNWSSSNPWSSYWWYESTSNWWNDSSSSDWDSGGSSFDGWGGSSNGWGYGD